MLDLGVLTIKLLVLSWIIAKRQLIHNRAAQRNSWFESYDFIVVGAGGAGCVVAKRLAEDPRVNVLLLEAGGPADVIYTDIVLYDSTNLIEINRPDLHWRYFMDPMVYNGQTTGKRKLLRFGKMIGGSSSHNQIVYNRGNRKTFDNWEKVYGAVGWSYSDVLPYFLKFEKNNDQNLVLENRGFHNVSGSVQISSQSSNHPALLEKMRKVFLNLGYLNTDFSGANQTGSAYFQLFLDSKGNRVSSGTAYLYPNIHRSNLHIVARALVTKVIFNGTTAVGVEFERNDTSFSVYSRKEVIISAGVANSPHLLMLSGVGVNSHLKNHKIPVLMDLPVGNNLVDHPQINFKSKVLDPSYYIRQRLLNFQQLSEHFLNNSGPLGDVSKLGIYFSSTNYLDKSFPNCLAIFDFHGSVMNNKVEMDIPNSRGTVRLKTNDPHDLPRVNPNYYSDPRDFEALLDGLRKALYVLKAPEFGLTNILETQSFESIGCPNCPGKHMYECNEGLKCMLLKLSIGSHHHGGTCRMGAVNRADTVVDPKLRIKNLKNVRVCDASIYPEVPNSNTYASVLMIGEKCAQLIKECHHLD